MRMRTSLGIAAAAAVLGLGFAPAPAQSAQAYYGGLLHETLGGASLGLDPLGRLAVTNIGSSGADGVRVPVPEGARGLVAQLDLDPGGAGGVSRQLVVVGEDSELSGPLALTIAIDLTVAGRADIHADASASGATGLWVEVLDGDQYVFCRWIEEVFVNVEPVSPVAARHGDHRTNIAINQPGVKITWESPTLQKGQVRWQERVRMQFDSGVEVTGDGLRFSRIDGPPIGRLTELRITGMQPPAAGTGSIAIAQEGVKVWGGVARAIGEAHFEPSAAAPFAVANLGSSGVDGVSIIRGDVDGDAPANRSKTTEAKVVLGGASVPHVEIECTGSIGGASGSLLGKLTLTEDGGDLVVDPDFSSLGSSLWHARVLSTVGSTTTVVAELGGLDGTARFIDDPFRFAWSQLDGPIKAFIREPDGNDFPITIDGVTYTGDELEMTPEPSGPPPAPVDYLTRVDIRGSGVAEIGFIDIELLGLTPDPLTAGIGEPTTPGGRLAIERLWPNPAQGGVQLELTARSTAEVRASVHDVAGRRLSALVAERFTPRTHRLAWDGRDHAGRAAPAGVYFVRVEVDGEVRSRSFVRTQ